jgi:hypothetical protein
MSVHLHFSDWKIEGIQGMERKNAFRESSRKANGLFEISAASRG